MQSDYPAEFHREHGFTEADWLATLPGAVRGAALARPGPGEAVVAVGRGRLTLRWQLLPPRQIALIRLPRLAAHYRFDGVDDAARHAFMRYFDLFIQRGGG